MGLSENYQKLFDRGIQLMEKSMDSLHSKEHVYNLISLLNQFNSAHPQLLNVEEISQLNIACAWHDVWKAAHYPPRNYFDLTWHQFMDGVGSSHIFSQEAASFFISPSDVSAIIYIIRKHSAFQFLPIKSNAAKVFYDLDTIEMANKERLINSGQYDYLFHSPLKLKSYLWYLRSNLHSLYFPWSKRLYKSYLSKY